MTTKKQALAVIETAWDEVSSESSELWPSPTLVSKLTIRILEKLNLIYLDQEPKND